ncbi:MAG: N-6 DNA methylase [Armatimonadetes bacterium]|nr:N-6 DNA methylase [Armatimonadota bacterium]
MSSHSSARRFALRLARDAAKIQLTGGDLAAQVAAYGLFLKRVVPDVQIDDLITGLIGAEPARRLDEGLDQAEVDEVCAHYASEGKDPAVYFYEEFLRAYDPVNSRGRGVHYSPPAIVEYMVRGVESVLRERFDSRLEDAFVLDPCCGIGTFLKHIESRGGPPPRMVGMELSAPVCELASRLLKHADIRQADGLESLDVDTGGRPLVILGNPPYSGHSSNPGGLADLLADYRKGLTERNPKWLQDDYVKFIRMAQHRIESAGRGVVAFITNHSYLFNPTFRAMRSSLARSFDEIHVLDLHGNAKLAEADLKAGRDENVFHIQMGVGISFMVKTTDRSTCRIKYAGLRGSRKSKLETLRTMDFGGTPWEHVTPIEPFHIFIRMDHDLQREFHGFASLFDIFEEHSVGFVTSRDRFAVDFDRDALLERIAALRSPEVSAERIRAEYRVSDLDIEKARSELLADLFWRDKAVRVLYRPFDWRWAYCSAAVMERPRLPFMGHLIREQGIGNREQKGRENVALAVGRAGQATGSSTWDVVFCTDCPADLNLFRRGGAALFPLYLYENGVRRPNSKPRMPNFDLVFFYIYGLLHSPLYRERYAEFLRIDYPRIPMIDDSEMIQRLSALGRELIDVHLMRDDAFEIGDDQPSAPLKIGGWDVPGKYLVDRRHRGLTDAEAEHIERMRVAVRRTLALHGEIDEVVRLSPPWDSGRVSHS